MAHEGGRFDLKMTLETAERGQGRSHKEQHLELSQLGYAAVQKLQEDDVARSQRDDGDNNLLS